MKTRKHDKKKKQVTYYFILTYYYLVYSRLDVFSNRMIFEEVENFRSVNC